MAYRIERIIPGDFRDYLMNLWEGTDLPSFIGATSKAYLFDDKEVADAVAQRLAAKCSQTMETPHLKSQPITYEVVEVRDKNMITPEQCGASQLACNIINETFLGLDGFAAMRKQMAGTDYTAEQFGAELARIVDREIAVARPLRILESIAQDCDEELWDELDDKDEGDHINVSMCILDLKALRDTVQAAGGKLSRNTPPKGWESIEA